MYDELIYTRCGEGIELLQEGRKSTADGFKVYSCSQSILENKDLMDLPLLMKIFQEKQSFGDPILMEDAYLYVVPDVGNKTMMEFHPIPYNKETEGNYSHRKGNYIYQAFTGDFADFYPFELFGNPSLWDAKKHTESYYYDTVPQPLAQRDRIDDAIGSILADDIAAFISEGRAEAYQNAVSFIITQYGLPRERRKYLVIRDTSNTNIELWIAAIECAFSPRMASGLPFATHLNQFDIRNRYTINFQGKYQTQMNLQDPKQKLRFRAMLVGVDERDKSNVPKARVLANSQFIVLDGEAKELTYTSDTSSPYFALVTSFNEQHSRFCRKFLQMIDICEPTDDVLKLHDAYIALDVDFANSTVRQIADSLAVLDQHRVLPCEYLERIYNSIKDTLPRYLKENLLYSFAVLKWLQKVAAIIGDTEASDTFNSIVSAAFADCVYSAPLRKDTAEFWESIRNSNFADAAASYLIREETFETYKNITAKYDADAWVAFCQVFLPCVDKAHSCTIEGAYMVVRSSIEACSRAGEHKKSLEICEMLKGLNARIFRDLLLKLACEADSLKSEYYMWLLLRTALDLTCTNDATVDFAHFLQKQGHEHLMAYALEYRAKSLSTYYDMEHFLKSMLDDPTFGRCDLSKVYVALDSKLQLHDKASFELASLLQKTIGNKIKCPISAHICALNELSNKKKQADIVRKFKSYAVQGFPGVTDENYARKLAKALLACKLSGKEFAMIAEVVTSSPLYIRALLREIIGITTPKNCDAWNILMDILAEGKNAAAVGILADECMAAKKSDKQLTQLQGMLDSRLAQDYFSSVLADIQKKNDTAASKSVLSRIFGFGGKKK